MNLEKFIHSLLLENETVIIPGFGAFVSNYKPAEISENEIKPPSKEISFTQQIRNNDGLLVGRIADEESISHFDALKKIESERENIIYKLDKGEKIIIEDTGELFYNEKNEIQFTPFHDDNLLLDSFGLETISIKNKIEEIPAEENTETKELEKEVEDIKIIPKVEDAIEPETTIEENIEIKKEKEKELAPIVAKQELEKKSEEEKESEVKKEQKNEIIGVPYTNKEPEEKKKRRMAWYLLILIPIIIAGIFVVRNNSKSESSVTNSSKNVGIKMEEIPSEKIEIAQKDSITSKINKPVAIDTTTIDSTEIAIKNIEKEIIDSSSPKFYLVGGSFKEESNANDFIIQLKDKGFEPFLLGKRGNFYIVAIGTYKTELEAVRAKQKFTEDNPKSGAWVMEDNK